jgi:exopolysaccharide biosynthesis glucuronosyltransferase PssE
MGGTRALLPARGLLGNHHLSGIGTLTFVTVGNATQPFPRLLRAVGSLAGELPKPIVIQRGHTQFANAGVETFDFIQTDEYLDFLTRATLVISHAGAGTIIHAARAGVRPVVVPRLKRFGEHIDDHQSELAEALGRAGKVYPVLDIDDLGRAAKSAATSEHVAPAAARPRIVELVFKCLAEIQDANRDPA